MVLPLVIYFEFLVSTIRVVCVQNQIWIIFHKSNGEETFFFRVWVNNCIIIIIDFFEKPNLRRIRVSAINNKSVIILLHSITSSISYQAYWKFKRTFTKN